MSETISGIQLTAAGEEALDHAARLLAGVEGGVEKAVRRAAGKAAARLRRANVQAVRERYAISAANIRENENVQVSYSYDGGVQAYVRFSGARIPLFRFDGAAPRRPAQDAGRRVPVQTGAGWRMLHPGLPASGHVLKATAPYQFAGAFVARMPSGHTGIFERAGATAFKVTFRSTHEAIAQRRIGETYTTSGAADRVEKYGMPRRGQWPDMTRIKVLTGPSVPSMMGNEDVQEQTRTMLYDVLDREIEKRIEKTIQGK